MAPVQEGAPLCGLHCLNSQKKPIRHYLRTVIPLMHCSMKPPAHSGCWVSSDINIWSPVPTAVSADVPSPWKCQPAPPLLCGWCGRRSRRRTPSRWRGRHCLPAWLLPPRLPSPSLWDAALTSPFSQHPPEQRVSTVRELNDDIETNRVICVASFQNKCIILGIYHTFPSVGEMQIFYHFSFN